MKTSLFWMTVGVLALVAPGHAQTVLTPEDRAALLTVLDGERHSEAHYRAIMARFQVQRPFSNIARAEQNHQAAVLALMKRYNVSVPDNPWIHRVIPVPDTLQAAFHDAAQSERETVALLDRLIASVTPSDIRAVFTRLRDVSRDRHLAVFESSGAGGQGLGRGQGSRGGPGAGRGRGWRGGRGAGPPA